jgi:signal transduction histidine kinase
MTPPVQIQTVEDLEAEIRRLKPFAELGMMAAVVAHEIRNPLAGISANAELLKECIDDADGIESVDIILSEVQRLGKLVGELLNSSRERQAECRDLDLLRLANTAATLQNAEAQAQGVDICVEGSGQGWGDWDMSLQSLLNIIRNAVQASGPGQTVSVAVSDHHLRISDQGPGIPEDLKTRIFEPFVTGKTRGMGLGATVAKRCMLRQRGEIVLESTGPKGTTFLMRWPVKN